MFLENRKHFQRGKNPQLPHLDFETHRIAHQITAGVIMAMWAATKKHP
jgi:hypothetical protein